MRGSTQSAMAKGVRALAACVLFVVVVEGLSFAALAAIAHRKGHLSAYFSALLPHPALSRRAAQLAPELYFLGTHTGLVGYGGGRAPGGFDWYPLVGHYRTVHPDDGRTLRDRPTFRSNELGVYLLGGSVAEQVNLQTQLKERLQAALQDRYEVHVFNEGVGGYMSTQELVLLVTKIIPFGNPHYVIAFDGYNDWISTVYNLLSDLKGRTGVTEDIWPHAELSWFHYWFTEWQARKAIETVPGAFLQFAGVTAKRVLVRTYTGWLANHVLAWARSKRNLRHPHDFAHVRDFDRTPLLPPERAQLNVINAEMMAEACRAGGCRFFWVLQPSLMCRGAAMTPDEDYQLRTRPVVFWQSLARYYQDIRDLVKETPEFWESRFLDLSCPPPDVAGSFFTDHIHLTDAGANRSAEYLAALILADLDSRPAAPRQHAAVVPRER